MPPKVSAPNRSPNGTCSSPGCGDTVWRWPPRSSCSFWRVIAITAPLFTCPKGEPYCGKILEHPAQQLPDETRATSRQHRPPSRTAVRHRRHRARCDVPRRPRRPGQPDGRPGHRTDGCHPGDGGRRLGGVLPRARRPVADAFHRPHVGVATAAGGHRGWSFSSRDRVVAGDDTQGPLGHRARCSGCCCGVHWRVSSAPSSSRCARRSSSRRRGRPAHRTVGSSSVTSCPTR